MRWSVLLASATMACQGEPIINTSKPGGDVIEDDTGSDPDTQDDHAPGLTLDRPAYYNDDDTVVVTGTVTDDGTIASVTVGGQDATWDDAGAFRAEVPLADAPWAVIEAVATDAAGNTMSLQAHIALATEGTSPIARGAETAAGPAGTETLASWIAPFAQAASYGPPAEALVTDTCTYCPPVVECHEPDVTETISTTGDWTLRFGATLDTAGGDLAIDLAGVEVDWGLSITQANGAGVDETFGGTMTATLSGATPTVACQGLGLDTRFDASTHAWSTATDEPLFCFDVADLVAPAELLYTPVVPPALSGALCEWSAWLEPALATSIDGATMAYTATADAGGIQLDWAATPDTPPTWQALEGASPLAPDGIDVALLDPLVGAVLDAAIAGAFPASASATLPEGGTGTVALSGVAYDTAALAHIDPVEGLVLPAPVAYELSVDGVACESGHLVPSPVALRADGADGAWTLRLDDVEVVGSDTADTCGLGAARLDVLTAALHDAVGDIAVSWTPNGGLKEAGATLTWATGQGGYVVAITDAMPQDEVSDD